jgi:predicted Na+-dependent transporter
LDGHGIKYQRIPDRAETPEAFWSVSFVIIRSSPSLVLCSSLFFSFLKEIAAGIILVDCCPSGLASIVTSFVTGKPVTRNVAES